MAVRHTALLLAIILVSGVAVCSLAEDQTFSVSGTLPLHNEEPCIAVNGKTGDVLVVWCQLDEDNRSNAKIYGVVCKLQSNGSFTVGKLRLISGKNDTCKEPFVAYSAKSNSFLAVWKIDRSITGSMRTDIQARGVNVKGKPVGGTFDVLPTTDRLDYGVVLAAVPPSVRKAVPKAVFLACWQITPKYPTEYATHAGLWTVLLDEKGKVVESAKRIMKMDYKPNTYMVGETVPHRIITSEKVPFYLTMYNVGISNGERYQETFLVKLDNRGGFSGKVLLDGGQTPIDTTVAMVSKKKLLVSWYNFDEYRCCNQLLKSTLKKKNGIYTPVSGDSGTSELIGQEDGGAFEIITTYPNFHTVRFNSKGKMIGAPVKHSPVSTVTGDFMAVEIPGMSEILMVAKRVLGGNKAEIQGTILNVN